MSEIAVSLNLSDGRTLRFGGDEASDQDVPYDIAWDTQIPGGFGAASITLPRPANLYADDARLFSDVVIYGTGAEVLYEGYVTAVPQVGAQEIQLQCSGWSSTLERIQTFKEVFVDRDLNRWSEGSIERQIIIRDSFSYRAYEGPSTIQDDASPALILTFDAGRSNLWSEAWYDPGAGSSVRSIYYELTSKGTTSSYVGRIGTSDDQIATNTDSTADFLTGTNSSATGTYTRTGTAYRYGRIVMTLFGTVGIEDAELRLRNLAVYGDHGLTLRGSDPKGVIASDIIPYIVANAPLNIDSIEQTSFVIPHLAFTEDVSLREAIEQVTALGGNDNVPPDWGCYENRGFFWKSPGTYGKTWRVRRDQSATATAEGPDADSRVAGIKVNYQDPAGNTRSVGPVGSNSDYETDELLDIDPENPAKRIPGAFGVESVGITSQAGAVNIGKLILNERNRLVWRGGIELQGEVTDENGNPYPVARVRAGDQIVIEDDADTTPRPIQSTSYNHSSLSLSANVGARPDTLEALLGRLAAVTDLFGT